jgi:integrase/recombinase XerC
MSSNPPNRPNPSIAELDAARMLLTRLGLRAEDLLDAPISRLTAPTFRDYIPIVAAGVRPGTRRVYSSYWNRIDKHRGERRIDEPTPSDIRQFLVDMQSEVVIRRSGRGGHSAAEHMIAALPCLYRRAEEDGLITAAAKPRQEGRQTAPTTLHPTRRRRHPPRRDRPGGSHDRPTSRAAIVRRVVAGTRLAEIAPIGRQE